MRPEPTRQEKIAAIQKRIGELTPVIKAHQDLVDGFTIRKTELENQLANEQEALKAETPVTIILTRDQGERLMEYVSSWAISYGWFLTAVKEALK